MKMVVISADEYEKLSNAKKESETKIESYKQCAAGYESRIKELTEELDKLKNAYRSASIKKVLNGVYGTEQDVCCRISNGLNKSMFDKITELSDENEKLKDEKQSLKYRIGLFETELLTKNATLGKLEKENKELKASTVSFECHKKLIEDNERLADENRKLETKVTSFIRQLNDSDSMRYACENNLKELRQKYEAVLKAKNKLAAENNRLTNDHEITRLNDELKILKKHFKDLDNAYKSQKNELLKLKNKPDDKYDFLREQYNCLYIDYERAKQVREEYEDRLNKIESLANV